MHTRATCFLTAVVVIASTYGCGGAPAPTSEDPIDRLEASSAALPDVVCPCQQQLYGGASEVSCRRSLDGLQPDIACYRRETPSAVVSAFIACAADVDETYLACLGGVCDMERYVTCSATWDVRSACFGDGGPSDALLRPCD